MICIEELVEVLVDGSEWDGDCLIWGGGTRAGVYGRFKNEYTHRLMFWCLHGYLPDKVDHRCFRELCLAPEHLRDATSSQNSMNRAGAAKHSKTGIRGVSHRGIDYIALPWRARVTVNGYQHEEYFATVEEAAEAVKRMRRDLLGDFRGKD